MNDLQQYQRYTRRAVTLIELLVVISIIMLLAAYALPKLAPMAKQRKIREAARSVNVFLSRARSRAIETGRPCGVAFKRVDTAEPLSKAVSTLYQTEVPPPYAGDTLTTRIKMTFVSSGIYNAKVASGFIQPGLLRIGDIIQINNQGPWYTISGPDDDGDGFVGGSSISSLQLSVDYEYQDSLPWTTNESALLLFKILRQPTRTMAQPLTLPVGTTVDLGCSGTDQTKEGDRQLFAIGQNDVIIMFSPNGSVSRYYWDVNGVPNEADATDPIYLLIGWRDQVDVYGFEDPVNTNDVDEEELSNWQNLSNLWLALNPQTGLITVAEVAHSDEAYAEAIYPLNNYKEIPWQKYLIKTSRQYARQASSKGGR